MPEIYTRARNVFVIQFNLSNVNAPRLSLCSDPGFICGNLQGNSSYAASGYYCTLFGRLLARAGGHHRARGRARRSPAACSRDGISRRSRARAQDGRRGSALTQDRRDRPPTRTCPVPRSHCGGQSASRPQPPGGSPRMGAQCVRDAHLAKRREAVPIARGYLGSAI